jgi:hypothetical protein
MLRVRTVTVFGTGLLAALAVSSGGAALGEVPEEHLRVIVVTGGHDYDVPGFENLLRSDGEISWRHLQHPGALDELLELPPDGFDAVVLYDLYQPITFEQAAAFSVLFRRGMGLVALHHSLASYQGWPEYERIVGGKFFLMDSLEDGHERSASGFRDGCEIPVEIPDPEHPVTRGLVPFTIHDEAYSAFSVEPSVHPLLLTRHRESGPVLGWAKPYGRGRVVYLQSGHDRRAYSHPAFRAILRNAIRWVARRSPEDQEALALFNGEDLCGWRAEGKARFSVEEGILVGRQGPGGGAGDLLSEAEFDDLDLEVVWAMDWPGNSGVWFRYQGPDRAYQADILEWKDPVAWSGTLYAGGRTFLAVNADPSIVSRDGWNTFNVRARKDRLSVRLNGRLVADVRDAGPSRGRIGFQVHAGAEFRKMAIRIARAEIRPAKD